MQRFDDDAARREIVRAVRAEPGLFRKATSRTALVALGAVSLAPVLVAALATGDVPAAVASVFGNVGGGFVGERIEELAHRLVRKDKSVPTVDQVRRILDTELGRLLDRQDAASYELEAALVEHLLRIDAVGATVAAGDRELSEHLTRCFAELTAHGETVLRRLDDIADDIAIERHRERRTRRDEMALSEDVSGKLSDLARQVERLRTDRLDQAGSAAGHPPRIEPRFTGPVTDHDTGPIGWQAGAEVRIGGADYMLHDHDLLDEPASDGSHWRRQARAVRIPPTDRPGGRYVWLRQVVQRHPTPAADAAMASLEAEHPLARRLGRVPDLPHVLAPVREADTVTSIVVWPLSKVWRGPCETLADLVGPLGVALDDPLRQAQLLAGLAGLATTLHRLQERASASHRCLAPSAVLRRDDGRLVLRDLGLAGRTPRHGEVTGDGIGVAPEQRHSAGAHPGPATDVYQLAALAYRLLTGHLPVPGRALPLQALTGGVPDLAAAAVDAALVVDPSERPGMASLASALRRPPAPSGTPQTSPGAR